MLRTTYCISVLQETLQLLHTTLTQARNVQYFFQKYILNFQFNRLAKTVVLKLQNHTHKLNKSSARIQEHRGTTVNVDNKSRFSDNLVT